MTKRRQLLEQRMKVLNEEITVLLMDNAGIIEKMGVLTHLLSGNSVYATFAISLIDTQEELNKLIHKEITNYKRIQRIHRHLILLRKVKRLKNDRT